MSEIADTPLFPSAQDPHRRAHGRMEALPFHRVWGGV